MQTNGKTIRNLPNTNARVSVCFLTFFFFFFWRDFIFKKTLFEKLQYLKQEQVANAMQGRVQKAYN